MTSAVRKWKWRFRSLTSDLPKSFKTPAKYSNSDRHLITACKKVNLCTEWRGKG